MCVRGGRGILFGNYLRLSRQLENVNPKCEAALIRPLETSLKLFQFNWETAEAEASGKMEIDKKTDDQ